ncbi:hypothetical protein CkaCkLH20_02324 [Colletotrichum karsti]|uniref:Uncharacterized protein n=1 Tax=Colletotrichum karsti TaxID=1095194 RepID=A0A9P6ID00_9PEZI|nr:uncharacterized protein CkaCkLH20_02324 [Colletotrichum karsti]KAF9880370.1 hypothetical protein CkaCkLH20_02324 [Colletotrichum karsti]
MAGHAQGPASADRQAPLPEEDFNINQAQNMALEEASGGQGESGSRLVGSRFWERLWWIEKRFHYRVWVNEEAGYRDIDVEIGFNPGAVLLCSLWGGIICSALFLA